jgi:hypothetical protein
VPGLGARTGNGSQAGFETATFRLPADIDSGVLVTLTVVFHIITTALFCGGFHGIAGAVEWRQRVTNEI